MRGEDREEKDNYRQTQVGRCHSARRVNLMTRALGASPQIKRGDVMGVSVGCEGRFLSKEILTLEDRGVKGGVKQTSGKA